MKKSELRYLIREEYKTIINEASVDVTLKKLKAVTDKFNAMSTAEIEKELVMYKEMDPSILKSIKTGLKAQLKQIKDDEAMMDATSKEGKIISDFVAVANRVLKLL